MRVAQLSKSRRTRVSRIVNIPSPVGGMNTRDNPFDLPPQDAIIIWDAFPRADYIETRGGNAEYATGTTGNIKTLATYSALSGTESMFAATSSGIYNATSSGAVGAAVIARTDGKHQWTMFGDGTNNWLCMFNGVDKPAFYNGTTWTAVDGVSVPAITGVTTTGLIGACSYQGRLFLIEKDRLKFWYMPAGVVGGAAVAFDLAAQCSRGGYLMAALPFTYDGGSGMDDVIVFVTSMGEAICYKGTDPGTAANWVKLGTYFIGKPIGRRCMTKLGGDVLVLTENGIVKMSAALNGVVDDRAFYISDKIRNRLTSYIRSYGTVFGWEMIVYSKENALILNIPTVEDSTSLQMVMNVSTGAWCEFTVWDSGTYGILNSQLYFSELTKTYVAWSGTTDRGTAITCYAQTANFSVGSKEKKQVKVITINGQAASSSTPISIGLFLDGVSANYASTSTFPAGTASVNFSAFGGTGSYVGISISVNGSGVKFYWYATSLVFESGGLI